MQVLLKTCEEAYVLSNDIEDFNKLYTLRCKNDLRQKQEYNNRGRYVNMTLCQMRPITLLRHALDNLKYIFTCSCGREYLQCISKTFIRHAYSTLYVPDYTTHRYKVLN